MLIRHPYKAQCFHCFSEDTRHWSGDLAIEQQNFMSICRFRSDFGLLNGIVSTNDTDMPELSQTKNRNGLTFVFEYAGSLRLIFYFAKSAMHLYRYELHGGMTLHSDLSS